MANPFLSRPDFPLINGVEYSWASITVVIGGTVLTGLRGVSYKDGQTIDPYYALGNKPVAVSEGNIEYEASLKVSPTTAQILEESSPTGRLQDIDFFDVIISFNAGLKVQTHTLKNCKFTSNMRDASQGDTALEVELPLFVSEIKWL